MEYRAFWGHPQKVTSIAIVNLSGRFRPVMLVLRFISTRLITLMGHLEILRCIVVCHQTGDITDNFSAWPGTNGHTIKLHTSRSHTTSRRRVQVLILASHLGLPSPRGWETQASRLIKLARSGLCCDPGTRHAERWQ